MTIEERIKEIEGRWMRRIAGPVGVQEFEDIGFLITELKRCREALTDIYGLHYNCWQCNCAITSGEDQCQTWMIANQALHPEGVK